MSEFTVHTENIFTKTNITLSSICDLMNYIVVYVEWESRVNFVTTFFFGDLYQNKRMGICNNLNLFTHLSSASRPKYMVIFGTLSI